MEKSALVRTPSSLFCPALLALKYPQASFLLFGAWQSYQMFLAYCMDLASICSKSACMSSSLTNSCVITPSVGEETLSSVSPSMTGASGSYEPSGSLYSLKLS